MDAHGNFSHVRMGRIFGCRTICWPATQPISEMSMKEDKSPRRSWRRCWCLARHCACAPGRCRCLSSPLQTPPSLMCPIKIDAHRVHLHSITSSIPAHTLRPFPLQHCCKPCFCVWACLNFPPKMMEVWRHPSHTRRICPSLDTLLGRQAGGTSAIPILLASGAYPRTRWDLRGNDVCYY